jgi:hypothetical protein
LETVEGLNFLGRGNLLSFSFIEQLQRDGVDRAIFGGAGRAAARQNKYKQPNESG